jgi:hypothetical protein
MTLSVTELQHALDRLPRGLHVVCCRPGQRASGQVLEWVKQRTDSGVVWIDCDFRLGFNSVSSGFVIVVTNRVADVKEAGRMACAAGMKTVVLCPLNSLASGPEAPIAEREKALAELNFRLIGHDAVGVAIAYHRTSAADDPDGNMVSLIPFRDWLGVEKVVLA